MHYPTYLLLSRDTGADEKAKLCTLRPLLFPATRIWIVRAGSRQRNCNEVTFPPPHHTIPGVSCPPSLTEQTQLYAVTPAKPNSAQHTSSRNEGCRPRPRPQPQRLRKQHNNTHQNILRPREVAVAQRQCDTVVQVSAQHSTAQHRAQGTEVELQRNSNSNTNSDSATVRQCDSATVRQCDSATVRQRTNERRRTTTNANERTKGTERKATNVERRSQLTTQLTDCQHNNTTAPQRQNSVGQSQLSKIPLFVFQFTLN